MGIREVYGFDKGREDSQVSYCEPISASLPNSPFLSLCLLLPPHFSTIYYQTRPRRQVSQASRGKMSEFMVCSAWGFIFIFSDALRKSIQALTAHFLTQLLNLFTTSAALSHIFTQSDSQTFFTLESAKSLSARLEEKSNA